MIDDFKQWIAELRRLAAEDGAPDAAGDFTMSGPSTSYSLVIW